MTEQGDIKDSGALEGIIKDEERTKITSKRKWKRNKWRAKLVAGLASLFFYFPTLSIKTSTQQSQPKPAEQTSSSESSIDFSLMPNAYANHPNLSPTKQEILQSDFRDAVGGMFCYGGRETVDYYGQEALAYIIELPGKRSHRKLADGNPGPTLDLNISYSTTVRTLSNLRSIRDKSPEEVSQIKRALSELMAWNLNNSYKKRGYKFNPDDIKPVFNPKTGLLLTFKYTGKKKGMYWLDGHKKDEDKKRLKPVEVKLKRKRKTKKGKKWKSYVYPIVSGKGRIIWPPHPDIDFLLPEKYAGEKIVRASEDYERAANDYTFHGVDYIDSDTNMPIAHVERSLEKTILQTGDAREVKVKFVPTHHTTEREGAIDYGRNVRAVYLDLDGKQMGRVFDKDNPQRTDADTTFTLKAGETHTLKAYVRLEEPDSFIVYEFPIKVESGKEEKLAEKAAPTPVQPEERKAPALPTTPEKNICGTLPLCIESSEGVLVPTTRNFAESRPGEYTVRTGERVVEGEPLTGVVDVYEVKGVDKEALKQTKSPEQRASLVELVKEGLKDKSLEKKEFGVVVTVDKKATGTARIPAAGDQGIRYNFPEGVYVLDLREFKQSTGDPVERDFYVFYVHDGKPVELLPVKIDEMEDLKQRLNPNYGELRLGGIFPRESLEFFGDVNHQLDLNRSLNAFNLAAEGGVRLGNFYIKPSLNFTFPRDGKASGSLVTPDGEVPLNGKFNFESLGLKLPIKYLIDWIEKDTGEKVRKVNVTLGLAYELMREDLDGTVNGQSISNSATHNKAYLSGGVQDGHLWKDPEKVLRAFLWSAALQFGYDRIDERESPDSHGLLTGIAGRVRLDLGNSHRLEFRGRFSYSFLNSLGESNDIESNPLNLDASLEYDYTLLRKWNGKLMVGVRGGYNLLHNQTSVGNQPLVETTQHAPYVDAVLRFEFGDTKR